MAKFETQSNGALIESLSAAIDTEKKYVKMFLEALQENILSVVKSGKVFKLGNQFRVKIVPRKARMGRNPQTGETLKIAASKKVKFTVGKELKNLVPKKVKK